LDGVSILFEVQEIFLACGVENKVVGVFNRERPAMMRLFIVGNSARGESSSSWVMSLKAHFVDVARTMPGRYRMVLFGESFNNFCLLRVTAHEISSEKSSLIVVIGEVWNVTNEMCGKFLMTMEPSLVMGWIQLEDGSQILSLLLESATLYTCINKASELQKCVQKNSFKQISSTTSVRDSLPLEGEVSSLLCRLNLAHMEPSSDGYTEKGRSSKDFEDQAKISSGLRSFSVKESKYRTVRSLIDGWYCLDQIQRGQLVRTTIAENILAEFWFQITGADQVFVRDIFEKLCEIPGDNETNDRIAKDVPRTLQSVEVIHDSQVQAKLSSILRAYAVYDPRVGYCQVT
jgi:hypothetical protein